MCYNHREGDCMNTISPNAFVLLKRFQSCASHTLTVDEMRASMTGDELEYRINELTRANYIEVSDMSDPVSEPGIISLGRPSAYRLTIAGLDYLSMRAQIDHENAEQNRIKKENEAKSKKDKVKDRIHDYLVAIVGAVVGALLTLLIEHFNEVTAWLNSGSH